MTLQLFPNDISDAAQNEVFWRAVLNRDAQFDDAFVYGVRSTRIFCRPTCPARRPRREVVAFLRRQTKPSKTVFARANVVVRRMQTALRLSWCNAFVRSSTTKATAFRWKLWDESRASARGICSALSKARPVFRQKEYADAKRLESLKSSLQNGDRVLDAQNDAGFGSSRALYETAKFALGNDARDLCQRRRWRDDSLRRCAMLAWFLAGCDNQKRRLQRRAWRFAR